MQRLPLPLKRSQAPWGRPLRVRPGRASTDSVPTEGDGGHPPPPTCIWPGVGRILRVPHVAVDVDAIRRDPETDHGGALEQQQRWWAVGPHEACVEGSHLLRGEGALVQREEGHGRE
eukprot:scaffold9569_cov142-Isochrysis_galbana.AAC.9